MTIDEVIKQLDSMKEQIVPAWGIRGYESIKLSIEALKRIKDGREKGCDGFGHNLPGETEK